MDTISISLASDRNFAVGLLVTVHSICRHAKNGCSLRFHVLDLGLDEVEHVRLLKLVASFKHIHAEIRFHPSSVDGYRHLPSWRGNYATYARLVLQDTLADEDWTIYTDVDTLWLRDVSELWAMRKSEYALAAVPDGSGYLEYSGAPKVAVEFAAFGVTIDPALYFCAGLLLMNLKRLRETNFTKRCAEFLEQKQALLSAPDQNLYNFLYPVPETQLLDPLWGEFAQAYGRRDTSSPRVIHYAYTAPWTRNRMTPAQLVWWNYVAHEIGMDTLMTYGKNLVSECRRALRRLATLRSPCRFVLVYGLMRLLKPKLYAKRLAERAILEGLN